LLCVGREGPIIIEVGIGFLVLLVLVSVGSAVWRLLGGAVRRRRDGVVRLVLLCLVAVPLLLASAWHFSKSRRLQLFGEIVPRAETSAPLVALTFDDGPTARYTDEILTILRQEKAKATFYVVGRALERNPAECQKLVAAGHELGNHSYSHQRMLLKSYSFVEQEIGRTDQLIRTCGYEGGIHFRSPNGKKLVVLPYYLAKTGRKNISWDVAPESYPDIAADADKIVQHVLKETRPGSIVLLHAMYEGRAESRKAIPVIIQGLRERGYRFVTVSELLVAAP
jgi:peptidoglycan/xylan/chitin deacetylase (PgdA/CDA1 family)